MLSITITLVLIMFVCFFFKGVTTCGHHTSTLQMGIPVVLTSEREQVFNALLFFIVICHDFMAIRNILRTFFKVSIFKFYIFQKEVELNEMLFKTSQMILTRASSIITEKCTQLATTVRNFLKDYLFYIFTFLCNNNNCTSHRKCYKQKNSYK